MGIIEAIKKATLEEGIEKGIEKGIEEGIEKGIEEGIEKKSFEVVSNLLKTDKFSIAEIANLANVSEAYVHKVEESIRR